MQLPLRQSSALARTHPRLYLLLAGASGLLLAVLCGWGFFALADAVQDKGAVAHFDLRVAEWLQIHGTERGESVFSGVSTHGGPVMWSLVGVMVLMFLW